MPAPQQQQRQQHTCVKCDHTFEAPRDFAETHVCPYQQDVYGKEMHCICCANCHNECVQDI